jgi:anti-sigma factor RsiW
MLQTQLEFEITRLLDGDLSLQQEVMLRRHLESDPQGARLLEEHRRLDALLNRIEPVPAVDWDALQMRIAQAVDAQRRRAARPRQSWMQLAMAACVLLALGVGMRLLTFHSAPADKSAVAIVQVSGVAPISSQGQGITQISVGPPPGNSAETSFASIIGDAAQAAPARVIIATGRQPAQDTILVALAR